MTDKDARREIEANQERVRNRTREQEDDGPVIDTAEKMIDSITRTIGTNDEDEPGAEKERRRLNDEEQRPD